MNISSLIFSVHSNSSAFFSSNGTGKEIHFQVLDVICLMLGLPTHSYVMWLIVSGAGNGLASEFFILNFSVCEILLCLEIFFTLLGEAISVLFTIVVLVEGLPITGCPLFQCVMCVERYLAVVHPVTFLKFKPLRYKVICAVGVWVATFVSNGVMIAINFLSLHLDVYFGFILPQFFIFFFIQLYCCLAVLRALKQSGPGERGREKEEENQMKRRAFYLILITAVTMFITYSPYIISMLFPVFNLTYSPILLSVAYACFALGGLVQPFLFLSRVGKLNFIKF